jgi:hypothetical protein
MLSLQDLYDKWAAHPLGKRRAAGGRVAIGGFRYQFYVSLNRYFERVISNDSTAQFAFDGLSDLAELDG